MKKERTEKKQESTTIRASLDDREHIKRMAERLGMSQDKCLSWMVEQAENCLQNAVDKNEKHVDNDQTLVDKKQQSVDKDHQAVDKNQEFVDINNYDLLVEIKAVKKVVYRIVKELCRITDADVNDPDSGITVQTKYDDRLLHPEKYKRKGSDNYGKRIQRY